MSHINKTTSDYKLFKFLLDNRDTSRQHINRLKDAILHNPEILQVQPIIVNEKMEIIDGQHRFTAANELGLPIHYTKVSGLDIKTARDMNIMQRRWAFNDYARSHAKAGNLNYKAFLQYQHEYPLIKNQTIMVYMAGRQQSGIGTKFRDGSFVMEQDNVDITDMLNKATKIAEIIVVPFSNSLAMAMLDCFNNEDFDFDRFIDKLSKKPEAITRGAIKREYLHQIEDIYNYNNKITTRLF